MQRRKFLQIAGLTAAGRVLAQQPQSFLAPTARQDVAQTEFNLRIEPVTVELAPNHVISTIGYNGTSPGPLMMVCLGEKASAPGSRTAVSMGRSPAPPL